MSVVIAVDSDGAELRECLAHCAALDYPDFEVIVLPDEDLPVEVSTSWPPGKLRVVATGAILPGEKRDRGVDAARGEIVAFLDGDAYPPPNYLRVAVSLFAADDVAAVCGPAVTPVGSSAARQASGEIYASLLGGGPHRHRYVPGVRRDVDDYPSCNLLVRRDGFLAVGGFDTHYWPGEDTVLCLKLTEDRGRRIVYDPEVLVYHHRRPLLVPHLRQVASYARQRGLFVRRFPGTSRRIGYFLPSLLVVALVAGGIGCLVDPRPWAVYAGGVAAYLLAVAASSLGCGRPLLTPAIAVGTVATHLCYGIFFGWGLLRPESRVQPARVVAS